MSRLTHAMLASGCLFMLGLQSCDKEVLTGQPEWLGNSIYERLEEGIDVDGKKQSFDVTLKLIEDLGLKEVLAHTGSRTIFVASDASYDEWFRTNTWGVRKYEDLSLAQKKMLINNSMINNAYLLELMSNVSGNPPQQGYCMRRETTSNIQDSVFTMSPEDMPAENPLGRIELDSWRRFRNNNQSIRIFKDNTSAPMIHFLPEFMQRNKITSRDLELLSNGKSSSITDSWINGRKVVSAEQTCKNGYIYVVDGVIEASYNMADIISKDPRMSRWSSMLNRFAAPFYDKVNSDEYNRLHNTNDSIYVLRYYSQWNASRNRFYKTPEDLNAPAMLAFDPSWNQYMYKNSMNYDMHYDAGAMIVPTNEALDAWWDGAGVGLQKEYGSWENIPAKTLAELLNVNMLQSFVDAVPSKFHTIVDDSKVELGIKPGNIVESFMGCNGVVYLVDEVFSPSKFRSVVYPALARQSLMSVIYYAIDNYDFGPYLNSMESTFSMILPYNVSESLMGDQINPEAKFLRYIDPCTYGLSQQTLFEFYFDEEEQKVVADRYLCTLDENGQPVELERIAKATDAMIKNRLSDLVDNLIIIGKLTPDQKYYKTKAGSIIYVDMIDEDHVNFAGGFQMDYGKTLPTVEMYDMTQSNGNGKSYGIQDEVVNTSAKSVYNVLEATPEFSLFFDLLQEDETTNSFLVSQTGSGTKLYCANDQSNKNIRLFENYNYTVYVPTNESIQKLIDDGYLPTWADYEKYEGNEAAQKWIATRIENFLRYHIQDNSIYIGGTPVNAAGGNNKFETGMLNPNNKRFYSVEVTADNKGLTIIDQKDNLRHVTMNNGLYNITCREYWMTKSSGTIKTTVRTLNASSNAVIHQIDGVLLFDDSMDRKWTDAIKDVL